MAAEAEAPFRAAVRQAFREAHDREPRLTSYAGSPGLGEVDLQGPR